MTTATEDEAPKEMSFGTFDDMGIDGLFNFGQKDESLINLRPDDFTEKLVAWCERELGQTLEHDKRERLLEGLSIFMAVWGRARKEEGMRSVGANREKAQEIFGRLGNLREVLEEAEQSLSEVYRSTGSARVEQTLDEEKTPAPWSDEFDHNLHDRDDYWKTLKATDLSFCVLEEESDMACDEGLCPVVIIPTAALDAGESIYEWEFPLEPMFGEHADRLMCSMEGVWEFEGSRLECHKLLESLGAVYEPKKILEWDPVLVAFKP